MMRPNSFLEKNYFELLGLPQQYAQDKTQLRARYIERQAQFHPDKHIDQTPYEKQWILQVSTMINDAYHCLCQPVQRAKYLLKLKGVVWDKAETFAADREFLMQQMALREEQEALLQAQDKQALLAFREKIETLLAQYDYQLQVALDNTTPVPIENIKRMLLEYQFYEKVLSKR